VINLGNFSLNSNLNNEKESVYSEYKISVKNMRMYILKSRVLQENIQMSQLVTLNRHRKIFCQFQTNEQFKIINDYDVHF